MTERVDGVHNKDMNENVITFEVHPIHCEKCNDDKRSNDPEYRYLCLAHINEGNDQ